MEVRGLVFLSAWRSIEGTGIVYKTAPQQKAHLSHQVAYSAAAFGAIRMLPQLHADNILGASSTDSL